MGAVVQTPSIVISVAKSHTGVMPDDRCILHRDQCCFTRDGLSHHRDGYNSSLFCLPVSQSDEQDDKGQVLTHISLLCARPLKTVKGYSLDDEDAATYIVILGMSFIFLLGVRGPDKILKKNGAQSYAPQSDETIKSLLQVHHIDMDILASMGV